MWQLNKMQLPSYLRRNPPLPSKCGIGEKSALLLKSANLGNTAARCLTLKKRLEDALPITDFIKRFFWLLFFVKEKRKFGVVGILPKMNPTHTKFWQLSVFTASLSRNIRMLVNLGSMNEFRTVWGGQ